MMNIFCKTAPVILVSLAFILPVNSWAAEISQSVIVEKLQKKKPLTRSFGAPKSNMNEEEKGFLGSLGRGITFKINKPTKAQEYKKPTYQPTEITKIGTIVKKYELPTLDFKIEFEFGSAEISGASVPQVIELAKALQHPSLQGSRIILGGHTDAKGSDSFNQILSQKRSDSVARLIVRIGVDPTRLVPVGFGEHELKNLHDPEAAENRRVEVINITSY